MTNFTTTEKWVIIVASWVGAVLVTSVLCAIAYRRITRKWSSKKNAKGLSSPRASSAKGKSGARPSSTFDAQMINSDLIVNNTFSQNDDLWRELAQSERAARESNSNVLNAQRSSELGRKVSSGGRVPGQVVYNEQVRAVKGEYIETTDMARGARPSKTDYIETNGLSSPAKTEYVDPNEIVASHIFNAPSQAEIEQSRKASSYSFAAGAPAGARVSTTKYGFEPSDSDSSSDDDVTNEKAPAAPPRASVSAPVPTVTSTGGVPSAPPPPAAQPLPPARKASAGVLPPLTPSAPVPTPQKPASSVSAGHKPAAVVSPFAAAKKPAAPTSPPAAPPAAPAGPKKFGGSVSAQNKSLPAAKAPAAPAAALSPAAGRRSSAGVVAADLPVPPPPPPAAKGLDQTCTFLGNCTCPKCR